MESNKQLGVQ